MCIDDYLDHPEDYQDPPDRSRYDDCEDGIDFYVEDCEAAGIDPETGMYVNEDKETEEDE
jgi:hypothetical protein